MIRRWPRLCGAGLVMASGVSMLLHRAVYEAARHGPAQAAEFALGLSTFLLLATGILLLLHGARLFEPVAPPLAQHKKTPDDKVARREGGGKG